MSRDTAIAIHRFGMGAKAGDHEAIVSGGREWLKAQLGRTTWPKRPAGLPSAADYLASIKRGPDKLSDEEKIALAQRAYGVYFAEAAYRTSAAISHSDPYRERLTHFWSNHFTVSANSIQTVAFAGAMEREAIRPHVTGRFADMLLAVARHPAMLLYLDNAISIGPNSPAGRVIKRGLNENFARELLELHTLGVDGGYTQEDVIALAKILTGWSVPRPGDDTKTETGFVYFKRRHEPGPKILLGKRYEEEDGEQEGIKALADLARHPSTARHIATKFARHFVADSPPEESIARLERVFIETDGSLKALAETILRDEAAFSADQQKIRTPNEFVIAAARAIFPEAADNLILVAEAALRGEFARGELRGGKNLARKYPGAGLLESLRLMGQFPWNAPSPKGWSDEAQGWIAPESLIERIEWSAEIGERARMRRSPSEAGRDILGPLLSTETAKAIDLAASPAQGLALLLASPEFQRR